MVVIVAVVIVIAVIVIVAEDQVVVDRVAVGIDDLDMTEQPIEGLALAQLSGEFGDGVVALVGLADLGRLLADLDRDPLVLGVDIFVVDGEVLCRGNGA